MADNLEQIQKYRQLVEQYESIGEQIQELMRKNEGHSENMSAQDRQTYRQLASERDDLYNQIKTLEAELFNDQ